MMKNSRYAFRRHFYQHAGFRYIIGDEKLDIKSTKVEDDFINNDIENKNNQDKIIKKFEYIKTLIGEYNHNKVLDIGCGAGVGSVSLSSIYSEVVAIDTTARIIGKAVEYIKGFKDITNINCWQADPSNFKEFIKDFDLIVLNDILHRVYSPINLLQQLKNRLNIDGVLITITKTNDDTTPLDDHFKIKNQKTIQNNIITLWEQK